MWANLKMKRTVDRINVHLVSISKMTTIKMFFVALTLAMIVGISFDLPTWQYIYIEIVSVILFFCQVYKSIKGS
jgi:uncharacterized protein (DUF983 family)